LKRASAIGVSVFVLSIAWPAMDVFAVGLNGQTADERLGMAAETFRQAARCRRTCYRKTIGGQARMANSRRPEPWSVPARTILPMFGFDAGRSGVVDRHRVRDFGFTHRDEPLPTSAAERAVERSAGLSRATAKSSFAPISPPL
jgi:hypothetical protein